MNARGVAIARSAIIVRVTDVDAGIADYPAGSGYGPRVLDDWEIVWLENGSAAWCRDDQRISLLAGDLMVIPPGAADTFSWSSHRPTRHGWIHFRIMKPPPELRAGQPAQLRSMTERDPMQALCQYATQLAARGAGAQRLADLLSLLVDIALDKDDVTSLDNSVSDVIAAMARMVGRRYRRSGPCHISLDDLARAANLSRRQVSRVVMAEIGMGPVRAFELVRLSRAARLLGRSDLTIAGVATACGYESPFHLSRRFRAFYGEPPSVYRALTARQRASHDPCAGPPMNTLVALVDASEADTIT